MGGTELKYVHEAFDLNWISPAGPHLAAFEKKLTDYVGVPYGVALSSGTAAIHLALMQLGVREGDNVICSTFTFAGSCNPIVYIGATPVFVDSERETWNMDPGMLREAINAGNKKGKMPKAIILVHLYGMPAQVGPIMNIANEFGIPVIEDAAEALGSEHQGKKLGSFGDIGIFSFNGNKIITTSGGGLLVSRNKGWVDNSRFLATQARDQAQHYEHSHIGYNYRLSNISAAIGLGQLEVLDKWVQRRRAIFDFYKSHLESESVEFSVEQSDSFSNRWLTTVLFRDYGIREKVRLALEAQQIESRPLWKPMHMQPVYAGCTHYDSGVSEDLFSRGLCLPSGSNLSDREVHEIAQIVVVNSL